MEIFNEWIGNHASASRTLSEYKAIIWLYQNTHVCEAKVKIIQEMIQIQCLSGWNIERIETFNREIAGI